MSTGNGLALLLMMNLAGDHTLSAHVKKYLKKALSVVTAHTLCGHSQAQSDPISPHLTCASTVCDDCSDILFNQFNSLHRTAAQLMISDSSLTTDTKLRYLGLLPLKKGLCSIR